MEMSFSTPHHPLGPPADCVSSGRTSAGLHTMYAQHTQAATYAVDGGWRAWGPSWHAEPRGGRHPSQHCNRRRFTQKPAVIRAKKM